MSETGVESQTLYGDLSLQMPSWSKYKDQPIDLTSRRSIVVREPSVEDQTLADDVEAAIVDFFYHEGQYWRARIPLNAVEQVSGQVFNFSRKRTRKTEQGVEIVTDSDGIPKRTIPILNHIQSRFILNKSQPIRLYPLLADAAGPPTHEVSDFVYSFEAVGPPSVRFNLKDAMAGNLISAHRFVSTREIVFERIVVENQVVTESPSIPLNAQQKRKLLVESLLRSHFAGMNEAYYMYRFCGTNNCTSCPLQILDKVMTYRWPYKLGALIYRLPLSPRFYLRVRGLDADPSYRKVVRDEFIQYIEEPSTQKRKRQYVRQAIAARRAAQT